MTRHPSRVTLWVFLIRPAIRGGRAGYSLKQMEQSAPAHSAGMEEGIRVGEEPGTDVAIPGVLRCVERHVDDHRRAENILARHAAPEPAVIRVAAVVSHGKIAVVFHRVGELHLAVS